MKRILLMTICFVFSHNAFASKTKINFEIKAHRFAAKARNLKPTVAKLAIATFYNAQKLGVPTTKPIITVIDYSLPSTEKRLWVLDLEQDKILHTSLVAHGRHSGENYTTNFSNRVGSLQTSIGLFLTDTTYFGRDGYSLRMKGLEKGFNDNAETRYIVLHGAPYVSDKFIYAAGRVGRSWGCPAVEKPLAKPIINTIKHGTLILSFYPDKHWLNNSKFIN